ncbi:hypothetical protein AOC36_05325 [Erysipelothrix larvae]|uniref:Uncharacterized protein n=1 Tax=Erysipelothrix larvae TaxID=1514105 RepID=A0A0X8H039_9FIRM|nr:DnaD domain protein [Erysipelothrix larvae]AMC93419.1 hypothetical protein AOC36_05325 [Erysipelothrix larvae]
MKKVQYQCNCEHEINNDQLSALIRLYQPVFAFPALSLYLTLYELGRKHTNLSVEELCGIVQINSETLIQQRQELERFMLVRTFDGDDGVTLIVIKPLTMAQFIKHPMFGRLYALVRGSDAYKQISMECLNGKVKIDGNEITKPFDASRLSVWDEGLETTIDEHQTEVFAPHFDVDRFFSTMSDTVFPLSLRTDSLKRIIAEAGSLYQISYPDMKSILFNATNFSTRTLDEVKLVHAIDKEFRVSKRELPKQVENPYELDPVSFLQFKQNHTYIVDADRRLIESLSKNFEFTNPVINALLEYVLEINKDNLNRAYVEKIASTWKRRNVKTLSDALKEISQPAKNTSSKSTQKSKGTVVHQVPEYSKDDSIDEDVDALRKMLKDKLSKGGAS